jgi:hypothetical protein
VLGKDSRQVLVAVGSFRANTGSDPTLDQIAMALGRSTDALRPALQTLVDSGHLQGMRLLGVAGFTSVRLTELGANAIAGLESPSPQGIAITVSGGENHQIAVTSNSSNSKQVLHGADGEWKFLSQVVRWFMVHKVVSVTVVILTASGVAIYVKFA